MLRKNVAAFISDVFNMQDNQYITDMQNWRCIANKNTIEYTRDEIICRKYSEFFKEEFESGSKWFNTDRVDR